MNFAVGVTLHVATQAAMTAWTCAIMAEYSEPVTEERHVKSVLLKSCVPP